ncbi:hypothetical protein ACW23B_24980 [Streptomyces albidoflavus]
MVNSPERDIYETRKLFGLMFQDGALFGSMSLFATSPSRCASTPAGRRRRSGGPSWSGSRSSDSSAPRAAARGDQRRHAQARRLARACVLDPQIILCDEPTRSRPGPHRLPLPAPHRPQRADRRDDADRHP